MSTSKRFVSLLMALVLMMGIIAVPAMAAANDTVTPRACTHPTATVSHSYGAWKVNSTVSCAHGYSGGVDRKESRVATLYYKCDTCGVIFKTTNVTQYRTYCVPQGIVVAASLLEEYL